MPLSHRAPRLFIGLLLGLAALLAGCLGDATQGGTLPMTTGSLPPIDLAAPAQFETATFAFG